MAWNFNPQPQTRKEFVKNEKRILDLIDKCGGDKEKEINKAKVMANSIDTPEKAYNRGHVARTLGHEHLFEIFYARAFELGSVTLAEHRDHEIEKIFSDVDPLAIPEIKEDPNLSSYDYTYMVDVNYEDVPEIIITNLAKVITKTLEENFDGHSSSIEEEADEHERLLKRFNLKRLKKIFEDNECGVVETRDHSGNKMYTFSMDSDNFRYACDVNISADGYSYFRTS